MLKNILWTDIEQDLAVRLLRRVLELEPDDVPDLASAPVTGSTAVLTCYPTFKLLRLRSDPWKQIGEIYALWDSSDKLFVLDGGSAPVHRANEQKSVLINADTVLDYVRFFCFAVRGASGSFELFEEPEGGLEPSQMAHAKLAKPLQLEGTDESGRFRVAAVVGYETTLFAAVFAVASDGAIEMLDDDPIISNLTPGELPQAPTFADVTGIRGWLAANGSVLPPGGTSAESPIHVLTELLLERALRAKATHRLIENFNASLSGSRPLEQFASLVKNGFPVVAIETSIPFVEEIIADLLNAQGKDQIRIINGTPSGDDSVVSISIPEFGSGLVLVPLFVYRSVSNLDRLAHDFATKNLAAIITCDSANALPEALRRLTDLTLRLPDVDAEIFEILFARVMGAALPADWAAGGNQWVRHVWHTDFEHPRRLKLSPAKAVDYIRSEVMERLSSVDVTQGLALKDLHGLGEAREFAEDLIADIHAAMRGELDWTQVDRGALLVGPPGTGKTTLARAIAKDCGVRFLTASAAAWMTAGEHLGHHIRAIRNTFAEARRYAPSILFIDEIDGLGNRELFTGQNAQYMTDVVNAVLEQIQGIDPVAPVFVIGATNFEDRVDPALRRAGRLDRVIHIPLPSSGALKLIYEYYLRKLTTDVGVDATVASAALGGLSLGLTAADVEKIVRGAARRARKTKRAVSQVDLIAELTNKPRSDAGSIRMSPQEIERTAIHEAGHAMAQHLSSTRGSTIGFVTVVPRADGALGFVASVPDERHSLTRTDYIEKIEVMLGGRAAEQLHYGETGISGGASSDLQVATELATMMVLKLGFGGEKRLCVAEVPSVKQLEQIETLLSDAYQSVLRKLTAHEARLNKLAMELVTRQEMTGDDVRQVLAA